LVVTSIVAPAERVVLRTCRKTEDTQIKVFFQIALWTDQATSCKYLGLAILMEQTIQTTLERTISSDAESADLYDSRLWWKLRRAQL
jgi:hypothetical protein